MDVCRSARRRLVILPLLVLVAAGAVGLWSARREAARVEAINVMVAGLCRTAGRGLDLRDRVPIADPLVAGAVAAALRQACGDTGDDPDRVAVTVRRGDEPGVGDGSATHVAIIAVDGADRLGLRIAAAAEEPVILGFWRLE